ncbi:MAG: pyridoxamine kinase [Pelosinus sp.]|nr:pyridoxamine kinase [Pelosinus sp.]
MKTLMPRVAAVHDLSCVGRCSLTVIAPVLSCMGIQVCPLPTAILSTHLGGFKQAQFCDFTEHMTGFFKHWQQEKLDFDCIYSGFLASEEQIKVVSQFIDDFSPKSPLVLVDPVMGDDGKLYSVYTPRMQESMKILLEKANVITPNYTEASFLLGESYQQQVDDLDLMKKWLVRLAEFGPEFIVITGIPFGTGQVVNAGYERKTHSFWEVKSKRISVGYPGTGDIFASVLGGVLLKGRNLPMAMELATDFVTRSIKNTFQANTPAREGVLFETALPWLCQVFGETREDNDAV